MRTITDIYLTDNTTEYQSCATKADTAKAIEYLSEICGDEPQVADAKQNLFKTTSTILNLEYIVSDDTFTSIAELMSLVYKNAPMEFIKLYTRLINISKSPNQNNNANKAFVANLLVYSFLAIAKNTGTNKYDILFAGLSVGVILSERLKFKLIEEHGDRLTKILNSADGSEAYLLELEKIVAQMGPYEEKEEGAKDKNACISLLVLDSLHKNNNKLTSLHPERLLNILSQLKCDSIPTNYNRFLDSAKNKNDINLKALKLGIFCQLFYAHNNMNYLPQGASFLLDLLQYINKYNGIHFLDKSLLTGELCLQLVTILPQMEQFISTENVFQIELQLIFLYLQQSQTYQMSQDPNWQDSHHYAIKRFYALSDKIDLTNKNDIKFYIDNFIASFAPYDSSPHLTDNKAIMLFVFCNKIINQCSDRSTLEEIACHLRDKLNAPDLALDDSKSSVWLMMLLLENILVLDKNFNAMQSTAAPDSIDYIASSPLHVGKADLIGLTHSLASAILKNISFIDQPHFRGQLKRLAQNVLNNHPTHANNALLNKFLLQCKIRLFEYILTKTKSITDPDAAQFYAEISASLEKIAFQGSWNSEHKASIQLEKLPNDIQHLVKETFPHPVFSLADFLIAFNELGACQFNTYNLSIKTLLNLTSEYNPSQQTLETITQQINILLELHHDKSAPLLNSQHFEMHGQADVFFRAILQHPNNAKALTEAVGILFFSFDTAKGQHASCLNNLFYTNSMDILLLQPTHAAIIADICVQIRRCESTLRCHTVSSSREEKSITDGSGSLFHLRFPRQTNLKEECKDILKRVAIQNPDKLENFLTIIRQFEIQTVSDPNFDPKALQKSLCALISNDDMTDVAAQTEQKKKPTEKLHQPSAPTLWSNQDTSANSRDVTPAAGQTSSWCGVS